MVVAPWVVHSIYSYTVGPERDLSYLLVFPFMLWRMFDQFHNQLWISLSRYQTAKGKGRIVDKGLEFEQVDRERNWSVKTFILAQVLARVYVEKYEVNFINLGLHFEYFRDDQIIFNGILFYLGGRHLPGAQNLPFWNTEGVIMTFLIHAGPVEFLYYWLHRALHHHFLYSRYHSHHHSSIVTEPITCKNYCTQLRN